jgi:hypothetical protein
VAFLSQSIETAKPNVLLNTVIKVAGWSPKHALPVGTESFTHKINHTKSLFLELTLAQCLVVLLVNAPLQSVTGNAGRSTNAIFLFAPLIVKLVNGVTGVLVIRAATTPHQIAGHALELPTESETSSSNLKMEANYALISEKLKRVMSFLAQFLARLLLGLLGVNALHDVVVVKDFALVTSS